MRADDTTMRRALDRARRAITYRARAGRWLLALGIAASVLGPVLGPAAPVHADPPPDPAARLQIIVHSVYIRDDNDDVGSGEMQLNVRLSDFGPGGTGTEQVVAFWSEEFDADSGTLHSLERLTPQDGDQLAGGATPREGVPVYDGRRYRMLVGMFDQDVLRDDDLGWFWFDVNAENGWALGTSTIRSHHDDGSPGDFDITFEIRRTPLPDLLVDDFTIAGLPGSELVCSQIRNVGERFSGPIPLIVRTEGKIVEQTTLTGLDAGTSIPHCVPRSSLPAHKHNLVFSLDDARQIPEMEELNNVDFVLVEASSEGIPDAAPSPVAVSSPAPPSGTKLDLTVTAIKINGQAPDDKDDCKVGKNGVTVVVKNDGKADAGSFAVRLTADDDTYDTAVDGLRAGQQREVRFANVTLSKGEHTLRAVADAQHAIDESSEDTNDLTVTARCQG